MKKLRKILTYNIKSLIGFEFIYKVLSSIIFVPLFLEIFKLITKITGYSYLTFENFLSFLLNPLTILFLIILLMFITFYTMLDISTIIVILDRSYHNKKITIKEAFLTACQKSKRVLNFKNLLLPFLVIFLIPFLNVGISTSFMSTIKLPEFISDFILNNRVLFITYNLFLIILTIILFRWLYTMHYFVLEDCNFKEARKKSIKLSKKNKIKDFVKIIITQIILSILYILFIFIGIFLILLVYKWLGKLNIFGNLSITIIWLLIALSFIIVMLLSTPISYAIISILYYNHKEKIHEKILNVESNYEEKEKYRKHFKILKYIVVILTIFCGTLLTYSVINNKYDMNIEFIRTMAVTAHRGASVDYPENTMSAFKGAKEYGADWIELDVQQTKDHKLIVLHDTNLKRTTGINKNTWNVTYDEIKDLDAGSFLNKKYSFERIPLLEDVIKYAKANNIKLNIELKPTGKEKNFEKSVVDLINDNNFSDNCVVTSQVYEVLENVKKYDKNIKTVYVMSLAYGDILKLNYADNFSIEASSITKTLVNKIHNSGKEIYAWTVNTKESINKMVELNVDNIITDNITLAKEVIYKSKTSNIVNEYLKIVIKLFN